MTRSSAQKLNDIGKYTVNLQFCHLDCGAKQAFSTVMFANAVW